MPKGMHPNSLKALEENRYKGQFKAGEKQVAIATKAGIQNGVNAKRRRTMREELETLLEGTIEQKDKNGNVVKADVSVNIYAWLKAQTLGKPVELCCAIGDDTIDGKPYSDIVGIARDFINLLGGFEKFAEWGLIGHI